MVDKIQAMEELAAVEKMEIKELKASSKEWIVKKLLWQISNENLSEPYNPENLDIRKAYAWCIECLYFLGDDEPFTIDSIEGFLLDGYEKQDPQDTTDEKLLIVGAHLKLKYNIPEISIFNVTISEKDIEPKFLTNFNNFWNMLRKKDNEKDN